MGRPTRGMSNQCCPKDFYQPSGESHGLQIYIEPIAMTIAK